MKYKILKEFQNSKEYELMDIGDQLINETYVAIAENINLNHTYAYKNLGKTIWEFQDKKNITHQIKINYNPSDKDSLNVKFYWIKDGKPNYNKPPYTDEMVFNTHIKIFINEILPITKPMLDHFKLEKLTLDPTDSSRYRLYRIALNQVLDKSKYDLIEDSSKNLLYIKIK